jgi:hypothetical protein
MHFQSRIVIAVAAVFTTLLCQYAVGQEAQSNPVRQPEASKGLPPRATPADYQTHAQIGKLTLAAEFDGHSIPDPQTVLSTEDYLVVEVGLFGAPGSSLTLNYQDFSARINGKKSLFPARAYALVFKSLKDPEYVAPGTPEPKEKKQTSLNTGGSSGQNNVPDSLPPIIHIPIEVSRGWEQRVQRASLPEGERPLPQAGLIFFEYHGRPNSIELIYNGPAGKATLALQ